ncbi:MAG TPA: transcriptional repressor [Phycisphaerae bacterium]|nr:transcriptional repressor [Phycisphaerae bacterium]HOJ75268.1 transcriptional repressor [Phycisphaerae bacterium]HOM53067.1 transcriptional repressor [Phycisphaerae bacterium]HON66798.1 transcriptional repressor [Phycisphaerae bacterium]HOQ85809.1 transcriptional repressor [Phycisphaerae bacterium]
MTKEVSSQDIEAAEALFRDFLRDRGLKYTPERRMLLLEVLNTPQHFEAEQLLIAMRQSGKRVAKATIYRTLPLLAECGIIKQVQFEDNLARYEPILGQAPHDHMVCGQCRRIIEFDSSEVATLRDEIAARHRFVAAGHRFQIIGLCSACSEAEGKERPDATQVQGEELSYEL